MTSEQIETLRMLTVKLPSRVDVHVEDGPAGEKTGEFVRAVLLTIPHILPKLLDEREALLEALTGLENWITRNVWADFSTDAPPRQIEALMVARRVLDKVCSP